MPTSHFFQLNEIVQIIYRVRPNSLLDVGVGFGKYGCLAREYLELADGREQYGQWTRRIDGIEAFPEYLTPLHDYIYDNMYIGDALDIIPKLGTTYDLILLMDVLEHFTYDQGLTLLQSCLDRSRNVLVSTPIDIGEQKHAFQNPFETHRSQWQKWHFEKYEKRFFVPNFKSLIYLIGEDAPKFSCALAGKR